MNDNKITKLRQQLAGNIRDYMARNGWSGRDIERLSRARAKNASVDQKTISTTVRELNSPKVDSLAAIANVCGVPAWQLLVPGRASSADVSASKLDRVVSAYLRGDTQFRELMDRLTQTANM